MSMPIAHCWKVKAALGDEDCYKQLRDAMEENIARGCRTTLYFHDDPPCSPEQMAALEARLKADLAHVRPFSYWDDFPVEPEPPGWRSRSLPPPPSNAP